MSKATTRAPRAAKPVHVSPLLARYVPNLRPAAPAGHAQTPLISKAFFGYTLNRYRDGCELVYPDGRKHVATGAWSLFGKMLHGGAK